MKKIVLFVLLAVICLPLLAEDPENLAYRYFECGRGEVIANPIPGKLFYWIRIMDGSLDEVAVAKTYAGREAGNGTVKLYTLDSIYCVLPEYATIMAYTRDSIYEINVFIQDDYMSVGWHGGEGPDPEAQAELFYLHPNKANPLPTFFACTEAHMENSKFVRSWEEVQMGWGNYESSNIEVADVDPYRCNGDSLMTYGIGEATVKMAYGDYQHTFAVKSKMDMAIDLSGYPNRERTLTMSDAGYTMTSKGFCDHISILPEGYLYSASAADFETELDVHFTKDSQKDVVGISTETDENGVMHCVSANDYGTAIIEIVMPETALYYEGRDTLWINVEPEESYAYDEMLLADGAGDIIEGEFEITEGDTVQLPYLYDAVKEVRFYPRRLQVEMSGLVGMPFDGERVMDSLTAVAAGVDEIVYTYNRAKEGPFTVSRLPVRILPLLETVSAISLTTDPGEDDNIVLNAYYNGDNQTVEIDDALTDAAVEKAMKEYACGTEKWKEALPNSMSFDLPDGNVSISIVSKAATGYVLHIKVRGQQTIIVPNNNQLNTFNFVLDYPSAVVFYLVKETAQPAGAPVRRAKKDNDDPLGEITSIAIDRQEIVTGIESITHDNQLSGSQKILRDGRLLILRDGKIFDVTGQRMK